MASSASSEIVDSLDILTCPVCFDLYKEPIALPCGHSFCRLCIETSWENGEEETGCICPNCREVFQQKPKLRKNVIIANLVENIQCKKRKVSLGVDVRDAELGDVKSEGSESYCQNCFREATKRCVPCEILCCEQHLKTHKQKGHKLVDPGVNIAELKCVEHGKPIQLFCKNDGSLMCVTRTCGQHQNHKVVDVEIAHAELKDVVAAKSPHVSESLQSVASQLQQVHEEEQKTENTGRDAEDRLEEKRRLVCQFVNESVDLMKNQIIKQKMEKLALLGKQREKLEQQMESLREGKNTMDTALKEQESISFLKSSKDLLKTLDTMSKFKFVKTTPLPGLDFTKEEKSLDMLNTLNKNFLEKMQKGLVEHKEMVDLDQINLINLYGRTPSLDLNSANRRIKISRDFRKATRSGTDQKYPDHPDRFDVWPQLVASDCFSSGRYYWEVNVKSSRSCRIGICLNSIGRKGEKSGLGMNAESWCLQKYEKLYSAHHNFKKTALSVSGEPERVGFFLDCEVGELTCIWDSQVLHVFRGNFTEEVKPAIGVFDDGSVRFSLF
uniref:E3 ubiquitin/ISG15 ligase TRIM25-like n=1 Tax=Myxine glutinosa TaxID=7769 RepID=UPI00358E0D71